MIDLEGSLFQVEHPQVWDYFDGFDGSQYVPRSALRHLYPDD